MGAVDGRGAVPGGGFLGHHLGRWAQLPPPAYTRHPARGIQTPHAPMLVGGCF